MLRAVVIDDIKAVRSENCNSIRTYCPEVIIVGEADSVKSGISIIKKLSPDIVFLDVEMPDGSGFDLLQELMPIQFKVIFVTGFQDFATRAFRFSAIDYLVKPLDPDELSDAVRKAKESIDVKGWDIKINNLLKNFDRPLYRQKLVLRTSEKIYAISIQDIIHCEADKNYTTFYLANAPKIVVSVNLKEYELLLSPYNFFRTHKSHLINLDYFDHFVKSDGGTIIMKNNKAVPLSSRKKDEFLSLVNQL